MEFWLAYLVSAALGLAVFYGGDIVDRLFAAKDDKSLSGTRGDRSSEARGRRWLEACGTVVGMMALQGYPESLGTSIVVAATVLAMGVGEYGYCISRGQYKAAKVAAEAE